MEAVAIVPAYNEEKTVGSVLSALLGSGLFRRVVCVSDGSKDRTAEVARSCGAEVIELSPNRGKGGAMREALRRTWEPCVVFFDADLLGLTVDHVRSITLPVKEGRAGMSVGLQDYGPWQNKLQVVLPPITGQRAVLREILESVHDSFWSGYRIEAGINDAAKRSGKPVAFCISRGIGHTLKWQKTGARKGMADMMKMAQNVVKAMAEAEQMGIKPAGAAEVTVDADGRISGADGFLSQVTKHVAQQFKAEILPELQRDTALQERIGRAIGRGASEETSFWLKILAISGVVIAGVYWMNSQKDRSGARARRKARRVRRATAP